MNKKPTRKDLEQRVADLEEAVREAGRLQVRPQESGEKYRLLVENASDVIYQTDAGGRINFFNPAALKLMGFAGEDLTGRHYTDFIPPELRVQAERFYGLQFVKKIPSTRLEIPLLTRNKGKVWVEQHVQLVLKNGHPIGFSAIARDITERRLGEEKLRQSEEMYRTLIETSPDPIMMYNLEGGLIAANNQAADTYGVPSVADLLGEVKNVFEFLTEEGKSQAKESFARTLAHSKSQKNEYEIKLRNGKSMLAEMHSTVVHSATGEPVAFMSIVRDITGRRQLEEELRKGEARYRTVLEDIDEGYFENDLEGNLTFVNDAMCRNLGYTREELIGMNYRKYNDKDEIKKIFDIFTEIYRTGKPSRRYEAAFITKDGTKQHCEASGSLMYNTKGEPVGFRGVYRNVDERKQAEKEREKLISELRQALTKIKTLSGLLPICAHCKKIRDDKGYWNQLESYIITHSNVEFTHGYCPDCLKKLYPKYYR